MSFQPPIGAPPSQEKTEHQQPPMGYPYPYPPPGQAAPPYPPPPMYMQQPPPPPHNDKSSGFLQGWYVRTCACSDTSLFRLLRFDFISTVKYDFPHARNYLTTFTKTT
uniref:Uncharacterized protein n=1 Tax=Kalanchoe fedtschenkoi TaxID=63787 RepID=A0A7N0TMX8_KALFE